MKIKQIEKNVSFVRFLKIKLKEKSSIIILISTKYLVQFDEFLKKKKSNAVLNRNSFFVFYVHFVTRSLACILKCCARTCYKLLFANLHLLAVSAVECIVWNILRMQNVLQFRFLTDMSRIVKKNPYPLPRIVLTSFFAWNISRFASDLFSTKHFLRCGFVKKNEFFFGDAHWMCAEIVHVTQSITSKNQIKTGKKSEISSSAIYRLRAHKTVSVQYVETKYENLSFFTKRSTR